MTAGIIPELEAQASFEGLAIRDAGLGLDTGMPSRRRRPARLAVPGPQVALDGQGHFCPPAEARMEAYPKALEQRELGAIADRIAGGVHTDREVQAHDRAVGRKEFQRWIWGQAALEAADLRMRHRRRPRHRSLTQPSCHTSLSRVEGQPHQQGAKTSSSPVCGPFAGGHDVSGWLVALHCRCTHGSLERHAFRRTNEHSPSRPFARPDRSLEREMFHPTNEPCLNRRMVCPDRSLEHRAFHSSAEGTA